MIGIGAGEGTISFMTFWADSAHLIEEGADVLANSRLHFDVESRFGRNPETLTGAVMADGLDVLLGTAPAASAPASGLDVLMGAVPVQPAASKPLNPTFQGSAMGGAVAAWPSRSTASNTN